MVKSTVLFLCFNLLTLIPQSDSRFLDTLCDNGNYTANSTYETNLNSAVSSLVAATTTNGFFNHSAGETPDTVNAVVLCRGDVVPETCRQCIDDSLGMAKRYCTYRKSATVWYDDCMLRFSDETLLGNLDTNGRLIWTTDNLSNADELYRSMRPLMDRLKTEAAGGDSNRKFASDETQGPGFMTIYGLMQCTPELSEDDCYNCLETATNQISNLASLDVRILYASCIVRYSNARFLNATVVLSPPPMSPPPVVVLSPQPTGKNSNKTIVNIIVVTTTVSLLVLSLIFLCVFIRKKRKMEGVNSGAYGFHFLFLVMVLSFATKIVVHEHEDTDEISIAKSLQYSFGVLRAATNNFSENNKLGDGGFGVVYKGKLENGKEIAVKRLSRESGQGEQEFRNEVLLLAKLHHRNLVRLLGFSLRLLMYEFVQNASLDNFMFNPLKRMTLNWERRLNIITGIAKGLLYLHEDSRLKIIHRDLKASNILLDAKMTPKIADFGTARLFTPEESQANTFRVVGTFGYMAPEYALHGQFSVKSDVYSFGILILEIMTGRNNHSFQNGVVSEDLVSRAWKCWRDGTTRSLIDSTLKDGSSSLRDMIRCIHIGLLCVQEEAADRPTMASVVLMLASSSITLAVPSEPAFMMHTGKPNPLLNDYTSTTANSIQQSKS